MTVLVFADDADEIEPAAVRELNRLQARNAQLVLALRRNQNDRRLRRDQEAGG